MNANIDMEIVGTRFLSKIPTSLRKDIHQYGERLHNFYI